MTDSVAQFAAAVAAALDDPHFAAAVAQLRPSTGAQTETLDADQAAALLHLPVTTIRQYAREGRMPAFKVGRQWLFFRDELEGALRGNLLAA
jgi:excisionase family DNA binding protein